jgi:hypothetical protein
LKSKPRRGTKPPEKLREDRDKKKKEQQISNDMTKIKDYIKNEDRTEQEKFMKSLKKQSLKEQKAEMHKKALE